MRFLLTVFLALPLSAATVNGINIHWSSAGAGKAVILVHGWTCDETSWRYQVPALAQRHHVITLDLPGHGQSESPKDGKFSLDLFARAIETVRLEAGPNKVVLVGHSMGTPVIRQYARLYPQHVAGMVFVDGLVRVDPRRPPPDPAQFMGPGGLKARESMIRGMFTPATPPALQQEILKMMLAAPESTASGAMRATFEPANWRDDVMRFPVLGIYADKSGQADPEYSKRIFPGFQYVEIPGTGHFLMMEKPEEFNRLLIAFLDRQFY